MQTELLSVLATFHFYIHFVIMYPDNVCILQHKEHKRLLSFLNTPNHPDNQDMQLPS